MKKINGFWHHWKRDLGNRYEEIIQNAAWREKEEGNKKSGLRDMIDRVRNTDGCV